MQILASNKPIGWRPDLSNTLPVYCLLYDMHIVYATIIMTKDDWNIYLEWSNKIIFSHEGEVWVSFVSSSFDLCSIFSH